MNTTRKESDFVGNESAYKEILNKYNILKTKYEELSETLNKNQEEWQREENYYLELCDRVKELCENIYNKSMEHREMDSSDMLELIHQTKLVFEEYSHKKNEIIKIIVNESENKSAEIENLKNKMSEILVSGGLSKAKENEQQRAEPDNPADADTDNDKENPKMVQKKNKLKGLGKKHTNIETVREDEDDAEETSKKLLEDAVSERCDGVANRTPALNKGSIPKKNMTKDRDKAMYDRLTELISQLKEIHTDIICIMAEKGCSRLPKIIEEFKGRKTEGSIRQGINILKTMGLVEIEPATNPFSRNLSVYSLSETGRMLYRYIKHKNPVKSERDRIVEEHDNLEHGYGILFLYELLLQDKERYTEVSMYNRKNPIDYGSGNNKEVYIPDIKFKENGRIAFYEYERGYQGQLDYERKFNKLLKVNRYIYIITDSKDTLDKMIKVADKWIEKKNPKELDGYKMKICTATFFRDKIFTKKTATWQVEYDFSKSEKPNILTKDIL